ncbi:DNA mismatch repair protein Msh6 [Elysia marginata]|uniref:DNA mismatch repair protein n=1 Tax=Elysia marginata TaxID=1093978 RepID=A0AAV4H645_9GAST|nr:DNA mismatch repair protein Msh6 [Elysia marginata]
MSKTPAKGKQTNTLFSYFQKTPKSETKNTGKSGTDEVLSPRRSPNDRSKTPSAGKKTSPSIKATEANEFSEGDLVWAKLEGFPFWPSLVCNHPTDKVHCKGGKTKQVHVQFFDSPPSRAWIKERYVKPFKGSNDESFQKGGQFYTLNTQVNKGVKEADEALKIDKKDRLSLVVDLLPSSDEEEEENEEENMDLDPTIFDTEMSDEDISKENHSSKAEDSKETSPRKRKSMSPQKPRRKAAKEAVLKNKRRRIMVKSESGDEDSEDDFKPVSSEDDDDDDSASELDENEISDVEPESEPESPVKEPRKRKAPGRGTPASNKKSIAVLDSGKKPAFSPSVSNNTKTKLSLFSAPENAGDDSGQKDASSYFHVSLDFLQPDKLRDNTRKLKSDPDYNPRTLYVPESFLNKQTPAMRQWWEIKTKHFDTVLFFKVGKFYELYHMDAVVGVREVGLIFMKGDFAHSGFPEIAYNRYADALVQKGYKVGRVEQTETPEMVTERCKNMARSANKYDKVVKREVCQISTQGTRTYSHLDGDIGDHTSKYILAFCAKVGQFEDDRHLSRFRTLVAHYTPTQILYERGKTSPNTMQLINANLLSALKEGLTPGSEFWESSKTLKTLAEEAYFKSEDGEITWPEAIKLMLSESDTLGLTASDAYDLAVRSLGAIVWYLQYCLLDEELLSMKKFETYMPVDVSEHRAQGAQSGAQAIKQRHMVLDGVTMSNLDVVWNSTTQSTEGTLLERLSYCSTAFGKRLFHQWLCSPLCQKQAIYDRLDAVGDLLEAPSVMEESVTILKKMPDLERLLSRIHAIGSSGRRKNHPDTRAILYEEVTYSKRKIEDFLATIEGFKLAMTLTAACSGAATNFKSKLLKQTVCVQGAEPDNADARFPDIDDDLKFFESSFDHKKAKKEGVIVPSKGVDKDYDQAIADIKDVEGRLQTYLDKQKSVLNCKNLVYWGTAKNRYQIEVPETALKNIPHQYELMSSKKGAKRFRTSDIEEMLAELTDAEDRKDTCLKDIMRRIFHNFDLKHRKWTAVVECLSVLDVLISLATYSRGGEGDLCRPEFVMPEEGAQPFLEIREGRHPCVSRTFEGGDFIPNDTIIGTKDDQDEDGDSSYSEGQVVLVTGPNMGGKSTLMRQVGLITIMAQMGCYVPAQKCRLTPIDRIFTRLGASDRIMAGESTFYVELSETSSILQHATKHSLVLMDELGRGTATYDGTAIACAVVKELSKTVGCRSLFSTHYHSLVGEFQLDRNVRLGHMACMVENENEEDPSQETITFLYKFVKGACPKSYGFNAARLAHLPEEVIQSAVKKSREFEQSVYSCKMFRNLWCSSSAQEIQKAF